MAPDEFKNLGFTEDKKDQTPILGQAGGATTQKLSDNKKEIS